MVYYVSGSLCTIIRDLVSLVSQLLVYLVLFQTDDHMW